MHPVGGSGDGDACVSMWNSIMDIMPYRFPNKLFIQNKSEQPLRHYSETIHSLF